VRVAKATLRLTIQLSGIARRRAARAGGSAEVIVFDPDRVAPDMPEVVNDLPAEARRLRQKATGCHAVFAYSNFGNALIASLVVPGRTILALVLQLIRRNGPCHAAAPPVNVRRDDDERVRSVLAWPILVGSPCPSALHARASRVRGLPRATHVRSAASNEAAHRDATHASATGAQGNRRRAPGEVAAGRTAVQRAPMDRSSSAQRTIRW